MKNLKEKTVTKISKIKPEKVYDITVKDAEHYILDNGIISHNSFFPGQVMGGGGGIKFASDYVCQLSKAKDKDSGK